MAWTLILVGCALLPSFVLASVFYNLFLSPLRHIPGPKLSAISRLPYIYHHLVGTTAQHLHKLHQKYGEAVRYSPNEVSFTSIDTAWNDIYGFRTGKLKGHANMQKDPAWFPTGATGTPHLVINNDEDHSRVRRVLSHAFSERALHEQEDLIQNYGNLLVDGLLDTVTKNPEPVDLLAWFNWTTFDVIADLIFGKPFGCLAERKAHEYVKTMIESIPASRRYYVAYYCPWLLPIADLYLGKTNSNARREFTAWVVQQTKARLSMDTQRPDFTAHILNNNSDSNKHGKITDAEIYSNSSLFLTAGTETTATLLSAVSFLLCQNPDVLQKVTREVRARWQSHSDISLRDVAQCTYLVAVVQEALRWFPPVPTGFLRKVGKGGEQVSGYYVPEGTALCVSSWPAHHSERNFTDPEAFVPERWLGDERFKNDKLDGMQPFSFGPRNCLGKNLATAELRLFLAKVLYCFDMQVAPESANWVDECRVMLVWKKPKLFMKLTPAPGVTAS